MADKALIDACFMWCIHKGLKPKDIGHAESRALVVKAVEEYEGNFAKLNERQRMLIAGLHA